MKNSATARRQDVSQGRRGHVPATARVAPTMARGKWVGSVRKHVMRARQRRQLRKLLAYDDHTLLDMGHSRTDILRALRRPIRHRTARPINSIQLQSMSPELLHTRH